MYFHIPGVLVIEKFIHSEIKILQSAKTSDSNFVVQILLLAISFFSFFIQYLSSLSSYYILRKYIIYGTIQDVGKFLRFLTPTPLLSAFQQNDNEGDF